MTLPSVLVTDTNVWIDLENGEILVEVFHLPYQFITPDLATAEFFHPKWETLQSLGLLPYELDPENVLELVHLRQTQNTLSVTDLAAYLLARSLKAILVTGDRRLNQLANTNGITVHGVLWLLDEMVIHQTIASGRAVGALRRMLDLGARLPVDECRKRLESWPYLPWR